VGHPPGLRLSLLDEVTRLAEDLLRPRAEQVDRTSVPRSHLDALGRAGALALTGPPELGGVDRSTAGQVVEVVAGACAATWFVMTQHMTPVAMLTQSANAPLRDRLLPLMCTGEVLSGIAIAHLRRPDPPAVVATRIDGGWSFDGAVDWMTSWGICDVFLLCGRSADDVVFALVPALVSPGLAASPPQELLAMQATTTVSLSLRGYVVADEDVVACRTTRRGPRRTGTRRQTCRPRSSVFSARSSASLLTAHRSWLPTSGWRPIASAAGLLPCLV
jgi:alkylation response protein AidB-like acyl-CoA dehydrogenase